MGAMGTTLPIASVNAILDANTNVIIATESGDVTFDSLTGNFRDVSVQWNTDASLGVFASGDVRFNNHARTAGAGSVNVIAGWTGDEDDFGAMFGTVGLTTLHPGGNMIDEFVAWQGLPPAGAPGDLNPEAAWDFYVAAGMFGRNGGDVYINDVGNNRAVEVGSRYGNTNVAGNNVILSGGSTSWDHAHLGFRDMGSVFNVTDSDLRLGNQFPQDPDYIAAVVDDPLVAMVGVFEVLDGSLLTDDGTAGGTNLGIQAGQAGVQMFDSGGLREGTFIAYSDHFENSENYGNWWWRRLEGAPVGGGSSGIGNNLPEMGAGISADLIANGGDFGLGMGGAVKANITVEARGAVIARASNLTGSYAQIGHGGFAAHGGSQSRNWRDNVTQSGAGGWNDGAGNSSADTWNGPVMNRTGEGLDQYYSFNWENNQSRKNASIARLASVYGDVRVRAGLVDSPLGGTVATSAAGVVALQAGFAGSHNSAHIGHGGALQFGTMDGDIVVEAGGAVSMRGGYNDNAFAVIGHAVTDDHIPDDPRMGRGLLDVTGWTPDGKLGGGQHKQFRYFGNYDVRVADNANLNDLATVIPGAGTAGTLLDGVGIYDGATTVTGKGAGVMTNLHGNIDVTSETGGVALEGYAQGAAGNATWRRWSQVQIGHGGNAEWVERTNARGYINVEANGGDILVQASETSRSYAQIGHGGYRFSGADFSSQYLQGEITVSASGDMLIVGGFNPTPPGTSSGDMNREDFKASYAMVGHGGVEARQALKTGDITVDVGGDLNVKGGAWGGNFAQIGHGGYSSVGQIGGSITRSVNIPGVDGVDAMSPPLMIGGTADIMVNAGGNILMDHYDPEYPYSGDGGLYPQNGAFSLIGHGGHYTVRNDDFEQGNDVMFWDHTGNVAVDAGGSLTMISGFGATNWYTRIGHGATGSDRQNDGREALFSGSVMVNVGTDLFMSSNVDNGYGGMVPVLIVGSTAYRLQGRDNPVAIGHGSTSNVTRVWFDGDIDVTVGGDATMISGKAVSSAGGNLGGAYAQVGHGGSGSPNVWGSLTYISEVGQFTGDVTMDVGGSLFMQANPDGASWLYTPINDAEFDEVHNSFVVIGNGGLYFENQNDDVSTMTGNVTVTVGTDLTMLAAERVQGDSGPNGGGFHARHVNGFVQIGNLNGGTGATGVNSGARANGIIDGDVYVEVGNDLRMRGGRGETDPVDVINLGSYAHIGNGGTLLYSNISGDTEVNVGNNLTTEDGDGANDSYVHIGLGNWQRDNPSQSGTGGRTGDIVVNVGNTARFDHTHVGHIDMALGAYDSLGTTFIGVSRAMPFTGGPGELYADNGSVFSSGNTAGLLFDELRFYIPSRSNNYISTSTSLNGAMFMGAGTDFTTPAAGTGRVGAPVGEMPLFQRMDEIYLQPDWWSDNAGVGGGTPFPGGSLAEVATPGGLANFVSVSPGSLGGGTLVNAHGEVTYMDMVAGNTLGNYTLYYDSIGPVAPIAPPAGGGGGAGGGGVGVGFGLPVVIVPVVIAPFIPDIDLFNSVFYSNAAADMFRLKGRDRLIVGDVVDGGGDTTDDLEGRKPGVIFGVSNRVLTPEEEEAERRRRARFHKQKDNGGRIYWVYDISTRSYSSYRLFGSPNNPSPSL